MAVIAPGPGVLPQISDKIPPHFLHVYPLPLLLLSLGSPLPPSLPPSPSSLLTQPAPIFNTSTFPKKRTLKLSLQNQPHFSSLKNMNFCFLNIERYSVGLLWMLPVCCRVKHWPPLTSVAPPPSGPLSPYAGPVFVFSTVLYLSVFVYDCL